METLALFGINNHAELASYLGGLFIYAVLSMPFVAFVARNSKKQPTTQELTAEQFNAMCIEVRDVVEFDAANHDLVRLLTMDQRFQKRCYEWDLMVRVSQSVRCTDEVRFLVGQYCDGKEAPTKFSGAPNISWGWFQSYRARRAVMATA